jgi:secretion/DNA translocation related TadE-like protein
MHRSRASRQVADAASVRARIRLAELRRHCAPRDRGSATIWLTALAALLVGACWAALAIGQAVVARHRASAAADLAALAAVSQAADGPGRGCAAAARVASAQRASVTRCVLGRDSVTVLVQVPIRGPLLPLSPLVGALAEARAGPVRPAIPPDPGERPERRQRTGASSRDRS